MADKSPIEAGWFALCDVDQLGERAIYHTELAGHELVVWRAGDGAINVWENRCPHRGVRLSLGHHRGDALQCQYHGWQFGSGDGACRFVPAHRDAAPPPVSVKTWPVEVRHGFVWTYLASADQVADEAANPAPPPFTPIDELDGDVQVNCPIRLRTVAIDASGEAVQRALAGYCFDHAAFDPWKATECVAFDAGSHAVVVEQLDDAQQRVVFLVQPAREGRSYLHGVALGVSAVSAGEKLAVQRHHQLRLNALRDALEQEAEQQAEPPRNERAMSPQALSIPPALLPAQPIFLQPAPRGAVSSAPAPTPGSASSTAAENVDNHSFTVHLSRSEKTLTVPAGATLLQVLREHHVDVPSSCEQGVCGTCRIRVIDGTPLHRDDFLTPQERAAGDCMLVCVSRAAGSALTLDL